MPKICLGAENFVHQKFVRRIFVRLGISKFLEAIKNHFVFTMLHNVPEAIWVKKFVVIGVNSNNFQMLSNMFNASFNELKSDRLWRHVLIHFHEMYFHTFLFDCKYFDQKPSKYY